MSIIFVLLALAVVPLLLAIGIYNSLIGKKNRADQAESGIDVMLKKRYDLIPNLVDTVKGYAEHERTLLEDITALRAEAMSGGVSTQRSAELDSAMTMALGRLMVAVEAYPDLKANQNFLQLQASLNEIEQQLSAARSTHNAAVTDLNIAIETFPSNLVAGAMGLSRRPLFEAESMAQEVPDVGAMLRDR